MYVMLEVMLLFVNDNCFAVLFCYLSMDSQSSLRALLEFGIDLTSFCLVLLFNMAKVLTSLWLRQKLVSCLRLVYDKLRF